MRGAGYKAGAPSHFYDAYGASTQDAALAAFSPNEMAKCAQPGQGHRRAMA